MTATILQGGGLPLGPDELVQHYGSLLVELGEATRRVVETEQSPVADGRT